MSHLYPNAPELLNEALYRAFDSIFRENLKSKLMEYLEKQVDEIVDNTVKIMNTKIETMKDAAMGELITHIVLHRK